MGMRKVQNVHLFDGIVNSEIILLTENLHTIAPESLERTCWRQFAVQ